MNLFVLKMFDRTLTKILFALPKKVGRTCLPKRVLVIKLSAMGDALCLMPAIRQLHDSLENVSVDWLTTQRTYPGLFKTLGFISNTYVMPTSFFSLSLFLLGFIKSIRSYDLIIDFDQYYKISEIISYAGKTSAGFLAPLKGNTFAVATTYGAMENEKILFSRLVCKIIKHYGLEPQAYCAQLPEMLSGFVPSYELQRFIQDHSVPGKPAIIIYPGSSHNASFRRWPTENYVAVIKKLATKYDFIIAGGPDEAELKSFFARHGLSELDQINKWSLYEWLWIFRHCAKLFVGNDAGLLHLAESQNLPIFGIFGPNLYSKWGSLNLKSRSIEVDLLCRPCIKSFEGRVPQHCNRGDIACLSSITSEQVINNIELFFDRLGV